MDPVDEAVKVGAFQSVAGLAEQGHNCGARVATNHRDVLIRGISVLMLRDKSACADDVQGSDTEETFRVVDVHCFEDFGSDRYCAVDGVGNDENVGFRSGGGNAFCEVADD